MYLLGVCLTESPFDSASPCWLSEVGGDQSQSFNHGVFKKKRSYQKALDISPNDERTFSTTEHWPCFITLAAVLSDAQPNPLTKMYPFLILKGIQEIVGTT